jgi:disulfide bond formation protein DsbB
MSIRKLYLLGFLIISCLLLTSIYLQYFQGIEPCPLCTLQRITFGMLGIVFLIGIAACARKFARYTVNSIGLLLSVLGMVLAGRQIYLQQFPSPDNTECGVSLQYMMQILPIHEVAAKIFQGSTECAQRGWEFLSFNMAEWAFAWFALFLMLMLYLFKKECG